MPNLEVEGVGTFNVKEEKRLTFPWYGSRFSIVSGEVRDFAGHGNVASKVRGTDGEWK